MSSAVTVRHLTAEQLAERLALPKWSIYQLVKAGKLPVLRIDRRIRFRLADVERWEAGGGSPPAARKLSTKRLGKSRPLPSADDQSGS